MLAMITIEGYLEFFSIVHKKVVLKHKLKSKPSFETRMILNDVQGVILIRESRRIVECIDIGLTYHEMNLIPIAANQRIFELRNLLQADSNEDRKRVFRKVPHNSLTSFKENLLTHLSIMAQEEELITFLLDAKVGYISDYCNQSPLQHTIHEGDLRSFVAIAQYGSS